MRFNIPLVTLAVALFGVGGTNAFPDLQQKHKWVAPTSTDSRSPCPGLNTLANHGYLPHNGRNITIPMIMDAVLEAFNVHWDTILLAAKFGLFASEDASSFQAMRLDALSLHNLVEHDASISRIDFGLGDHIKFNESVYSVLANSNPGKDYYEPFSSGQVQRDRLADSMARNPNLVNTRKEFKLRSRETSLYLSIFGSGLDGLAPKNFVNVFFREERLPIAEGWKKSTTLITADGLTPIGRIIQNASEWTQTQSCEPLILGPSTTL
ncbi:Cloroperoxidase [Mycena rebaudengoi]|nr:Cloroperoxidase [Mycena rebaudengoi]